MNNHIYLIIVVGNSYEPKVMAFTCFEKFRHNLMHTCTTEWIPEFGLCILDKGHWEGIEDTITSAYEVIRTTTKFEDIKSAIENMKGIQAGGCSEIFLKQITHGDNNETTIS